MQSLRPAQGNAVMDLVKQCGLVTHLWDQGFEDRKTLNIRAHSRVAARQQHYNEEIKLLKSIEFLAKELGVEDEVVLGVLTRNLPAEVLLVVRPSTAA